MAVDPYDIYPELLKIRPISGGSDGLPGGDPGQGTAGAGTPPQSGGGQPQGGVGGQPQGGQPGGSGGAAGWQMPEKWRNQPPDTIARAYEELEKKLGTQGNELGTIRQQMQEWQRWGPIIQQWSPIMQQVGYDPQRLAAALQQKSQEAAARGDMRTAQATADAAQRAWADAMTPQEQEQWIQSYVGQQVAPVQQQFEEKNRQMAEAFTQYVNRFGDLALRAVQHLFQSLPENVRPKVTISDLLQEGVNIAGQRYDPLDWAFKIKTAQSPDELREQIRKEEREKLEAERRNRESTAFVGAGGTSQGPRPLRPNGAPAQSSPVPRPSNKGLSDAKAAFLKDWDKIAAQ